MDERSVMRDAPVEQQGDDDQPARPRPAFWCIVVGLVLAWLYCLLAVVVFLAYGNSVFTRMFGGACAAALVVFPVWIVRASVVARRGAAAPDATPVREMRKLYAIGVSAGVAYAALLFLIGAGESTTGTVG